MSLFRRHRESLYWTSVLFVLAFRIGAALSPYREGALASMTSDSPGVRLGLGGLGLLFLVCSVLSYVRLTSATGRFLALYLLTGSLHWGGPIAFDVGLTQ